MTDHLFVPSISTDYASTTCNAPVLCHSGHLVPSSRQASHQEGGEDREEGVGGPLAMLSEGCLTLMVLAVGLILTDGWLLGSKPLQ